MKIKSILYLTLLMLIASLALGAAAHAQSFSVLHAFTGNLGVDGANPTAGVTYGAGILYGTTHTDSGGNVYQVTHVGNNWVTVPISLLSGGGVDPLARVVFGPDRHLYGTTQNGGAGNGLVFNLIVPLTLCKTAACFWKENVLYEFQGGPNDGSEPQLGDLVWDPQGNIYGTTPFGGETQNGAVFEMQPSGNGWKESLIHSFAGLYDGQYPRNGVILDSSGNVFGTTSSGGSNGAGTVFELKYTPGAGWSNIIIYNFQYFGNATDGGSPWAGLVADNSGNLYGATTVGGVGGGGTVFELSPSGGTWTFRVLHSFSATQGGCGPWATLGIDSAGNLYGTTTCTGANGQGNVFKLTKAGDSFTYSSLHDFTGGSDGAYPLSTVTINPENTTLYGTTYSGGLGYGVVWMIAQ